MQFQGLRVWAMLVGLSVGAVPAVLFGFSKGAPPARTGAPGETTCVACHVGTALNGGGGSLQITFSGGSTYTPGQSGEVTVTITDPTAKLFGFEASVRSTATSAQAGTVAVLGSDVQISPSNSISYLTHAAAKTSNIYRFQWTAPEATVGDAQIFVAANAANGDGTNKNDHIYAASLTIKAPGSSSRPSISPGGIIDAFGGDPGMSSSSWISIYGNNFASTSREWQSSDFIQGKLPSALDDVAVTINGKPALIRYISSTVINVLAPADDTTGNVAVIVKNNNGTSEPALVTKTASFPAFYAPFAQSSKYFVSVVDPASGHILGKAGVEPRASRGMRAGEVVSFYASGLGVSSPGLPNDELITSPAPTVTDWTILINNVPLLAQSRAYLVAPGLYQINGTVPQLTPGDYPVVLQGGGMQSSSRVYATISQ